MFRKGDPETGRPFLSKACCIERGGKTHGIWFSLDRMFWIFSFLIECNALWQAHRNGAPIGAARSKVASDEICEGNSLFSFLKELS
jgi:hypothetical protein